MTAPGPTKRRILLLSMRTLPARLVRGSSRRIMSLRFRPANIRVINRRARHWAVVGPAVQNAKRRQCYRTPPPPPTLRFAGAPLGSGGLFFYLALDFSLHIRKRI